MLQEPGPEQRSHGITATSWSTTGPCGISSTGRVMPPQFHQPSRGSACLRFTSRSTSSLTLPGRRPRARRVNGAYGSSWAAIRRPLSHTEALRRTAPKCSAQPNPRGVAGAEKRNRYQRDRAVERGGQEPGVEHVRHLHPAPAAARAAITPAVEAAAGVRVEAELPAVRELERPGQCLRDSGQGEGAGQRQPEHAQAKANTTPSTT